MGRVAVFKELGSELYELDGDYIVEHRPARGDDLAAQSGPKPVKFKKISARNPYEDEFPTRRGVNGRPAAPVGAEEHFALLLFRTLQKDLGSYDALRAMGDLAWFIPWFEQVMRPQQWAEKNRRDQEAAAQTRAAKEGASDAGGARVADPQPVDVDGETAGGKGGPAEDHSGPAGDHAGPAGEHGGPAGGHAGPEHGRWSGLNGEQLAAGLAMVNVEDLDDTDTVDYLSATNRLSAWIEAKRVAALERFARHRPTQSEEYPRAESYSRYATSEVAMALTVPDRTAAGLLAAAVFIRRELPQTYHAMGNGSVDFARARVIMEYAVQLPEENVAAFESEVVPLAVELTRGQLDRRARRLREKLHPEPLEDRHKRASRSREVSFMPAADGMMQMFALLPAVQAAMIQERLDQTARSLQGPSEARTLTQLRADVFCDLLLGANGTRSNRSVKASINITVPLLTLMGVTQTPADLDGYGPIPAEIARDLAGEASSWLPILTDPISGSYLRVGRRRRRPPKDLKRWLRIRDGHCRAPGCNRLPSGCDLDHTIADQDGGCTDHDNLALLCRMHHRLKHSPGWKLFQGQDGVLTWQTPTGHRHTTMPGGPAMVTGAAESPPGESGSGGPPPAEAPPPF